jgi:Family of unknown function (DUF6625)
VRSMAANPDVSWLLLTEQPVPDAPPNVAVQLCEFEDLAKRIRSHFEFEVSLERPYKLCDFRPAFGEIFADELTGYDFWRHSDLDLVFGRIRGQLPAAAFEADKILFNGNFGLYRNTAETAGWYRHEVGKVSYRAAMTDPAAIHFDERAGIYYIVEDLGASSWHEDVIFDISFRRYRTRAEAPPGRDPRRYAWEDGEVCEVPAGAGPPGAPDRVADLPAEAGAACTGTGRAHGRAVLDPAERVRRPGPSDAVVGPGGPDPARPGAAALLHAPGATVAPAPRDPPGGRRRANHRSGLVGHGAKRATNRLRQRHHRSRRR